MAAVFKFNDERAHFICFNAYEHEDQFEDLLSYVANSLGIPHPQSRMGSYSIGGGITSRWNEVCNGEK